MARWAPHLTNFQHAAQVKTRAVGFQKNSSPSVSTEYRAFWAPFCCEVAKRPPLREQRNASNSDLLSSPALLWAMQNHSLVPASVFSWDQPEPCTFFIPNQQHKVSPTRDEAPHASSAGRPQECYKRPSSPTAWGLSEGHVTLLWLLTKQGFSTLLCLPFLLLYLNKPEDNSQRLRICSEIDDGHMVFYSLSQNAVNFAIFYMANPMNLTAMILLSSPAG